MILLGFESPLEHQKISSPFGGEIFFWSRPGSRSLSPIGEIPAGAPKNIPRLSAGEYFFLAAPEESKFIPDRGNPRWSTKKYSLAFLAVDIFSGRSRGVEVYPRQGKSPLEHQKISPRLLAGEYFFRSLPGSRSLSPLGEIPAGAPSKNAKNLVISTVTRFLYFVG